MQGRGYLEWGELPRAVCTHTSWAVLREASVLSVRVLGVYSMIQLTTKLTK